MTVVDALCLVGPSRYPDGRAAEVAGQIVPCDDASITICAPSTPPDRDLAAATRRLIAEVSGSGGSRRALARVDPLDPEAAVAAREALGTGAIGLYLDPWRDSYSVTSCPPLNEIAEIAEAAGVPVVVEAGFPWCSEPAQMAAFASAHPELTIVATRGLQMNMSGLALQTASAALAANPGLHMLTSGVYRQDWLEQLCAEGLASRLLYASMTPVFDAALELARIGQIASSEHRELIGQRNARRVFSLEGQ